MEAVTRTKEEGDVLPTLLYFGEVPVESSYHGSALLYRLLANYPCGKLRILERQGRISSSARRLPEVGYDAAPCSWSYGARILREHFPRLFWVVYLRLAQMWAGRALRSLSDFRPEAILTVHEGTAWLGAAILAKRLSVPLYMIFHDDWFREWPAGSPIRVELEAKFAPIYRELSGRFCVSPYMQASFKERFGADSTVLYPSRSPNTVSVAQRGDGAGSNSRPFTVAYGGTTFSEGYLEIFRTMSGILQRRGGRLLLFGPIDEGQARRDGLDRSSVVFGGMVPSAELIQRFQKEADVLFVPMSFAPEDRDNLALNFPSKLADYTAAELPILIYGPSYSSAVKWAEENPGVAEVVSEENTDRLEEAVTRLMADSVYQGKLGREAAAVGLRYFDHGVAERAFFSALAIGNTKV